MKRAHVSLLLVLGAASASLSAVDLSRGQTARTTVDESQICPCPDPVGATPSTDEAGESEAQASTLSDTCPFENRWSTDEIVDTTERQAESTLCGFAVTLAANWSKTFKAAEPVDDETAAVLASRGDAQWYESQAAADTSAATPEFVDDWPGVEDESGMTPSGATSVSRTADVGSGAGDARNEVADDWNCGGWICATRNYETAGPGVDRQAYDRDATAGDRVETETAVDGEVAAECEFAGCEIVDGDGWGDSAIADDDAEDDAERQADAERYGYLQPWCEENDAVLSADDDLAGACDRLCIDVPQVAEASCPQVESASAEADESTSELPPDGWAAICGVITEPIPWMLPSSISSETVKSAEPRAGDVIGTDDVVTARASTASSEDEQARGGSTDDASEATVKCGSIVGLCRDPRHSTGYGVARWLNRLNDGLGEEIMRPDDTRVALSNAAGASPSDPAKQAIAAAGGSRELPEPWWATLGVGENGQWLVAASEGTAEITCATDVPNAAAGGDDVWGEVVSGDKPQDWAPPAASWAPSEYSGCDAFCDETYDVAWPACPRHWAVAADVPSDGGDSDAKLADNAPAVGNDSAFGVTNTDVASKTDQVTDSDAGLTGEAVSEAAAREMAGLMVVATSEAVTDAVARALSVAIGIARDWSVLLDGRAVEGAATPHVARRTETAVKAATNRGPGSASHDRDDSEPSSETSILPRERIWCDAARWPYEDL